MTQGRPIHDCPYCGRTKFADETLPCCVDEAKLDAAVERCLRRIKREARREAEKFDHFTGSYMTEAEEFSI